MEEKEEKEELWKKSRMADFRNTIRIMEELWKNSRMQINDLALNLPISRQTVSKIKNKLWEKHYIESPTLIINPHTVNLQTFFMEIKTNPSEPNLLDAIKNLPQITSIDGVLGNYSLLIKFEVLTKSAFAEILNQFDWKIAEESHFHSYRIIETLNIYKLGGFPLSKSEIVTQLDKKKWNLLRILSKNHNPKKWPVREDSSSPLSEEELKYINSLNLSREIVSLTENDIIHRFTIKMGRYDGEFALKFYLRIKPRHIGEYSKLALELVKNPSIIDLYRTGEEAGLLAVVRTQSIVKYNEFIQSLYQHHAIFDTHTTVVIDEKIPSIFPPTKAVALEILDEIA